MGRLRLVEGRARTALRRSSARNSRRCGCWSSIPATCAPRCTKTRSRARTSPTGRSPRPSCPRLARARSTAIDRAVGTGCRRWCHDRRARTLCAERSRSTRRSKPTSRPRCAAAAVTTCGCSSRSAPTDVVHATFRDLPRHLRAGDVARREHVGDRSPRPIDGRRCRTARRCASTSRPSCPAASGSSRHAAGRRHHRRPRRRPHRVTSRSPAAAT